MYLSRIVGLGQLFVRLLVCLEPVHFNAFYRRSFAFSGPRQ